MSFSRNIFGSSVSSKSLIVRSRERVFLKSPLIVAISRCSMWFQTVIQSIKIYGESKPFLFAFLLLRNESIHLIVHLFALLFNHCNHDITFYVNERKLKRQTQKNGVPLSIFFFNSAFLESSLSLVFSMPSIEPFRLECFDFNSVFAFDSRFLMT